MSPQVYVICLKAAFAMMLMEQAFAKEEAIRLRNTHYYVVHEEAFSKHAVDSAILDPEGNEIAKVSRAFRKATDIEGTGKLKDGRVVNFAAFVDGKVRYRVVNAPYGLGVGNCPLAPFRSIAIDPSRVPLGSVVEIEETQGMLLPDGSLHDGIWRADDIGGAIKKDRVDLFIGHPSDAKFLRLAGIGHLTPLTIRILEHPTEEGCVRNSSETLIRPDDTWEPARAGLSWVSLDLLGTLNFSSLHSP